MRKRTFPGAGLRQRWWIGAAAVLLIAAAALTVLLQRSAPRPVAVPAGVWHVGPYTVRRVTIPLQVVKDPREVQVGERTLLRVSASPPYVVARSQIGSSRWTTLFLPSCAQAPIWEQFAGPDAVLLCPGAVGSAQSRIILFNNRGDSAAYSLPLVLSHPAVQYDIWGVEFGGAHGSLAWYAVQSGQIAATHASSGLLDLRTGRSAELPAWFSSPDLIGTDALSQADRLFLILAKSPQTGQPAQDDEITAQGQTKLGTIPFYTVEAVGAGGTVWAVRTATGIPVPPTQPATWYFVREVPGSTRIQSWKLSGILLGGGPGYVAYMPQEYGERVDIFFPLQHRTLRFDRLQAPSAFDWAGNVALMMPEGIWYFDPAMHVLLTGTHGAVQEIQIVP